MATSLIALSGGLDSAVLLAYTRDGRPAYEPIRAVNFGYGSKHNEYENRAASEVAAHYGVPFEFHDISAAFSGFKSDLLKTGGGVPEGHYEEESMRKTVVPFRNGIFLAVMAGLAESVDATFMFIGAHAGDHFIYPDCRLGFMHYMAFAIEYGTANKVELRTPFMEKNKAQIVRLGIELKVPFHLTRTCYKDQPIACGKCGSCQERLAAFKANGIEDPIQYECRDILPKTGG